MRRTPDVLADEHSVSLIDGVAELARHVQCWDRGQQIEEPVHLQWLVEHKRAVRARRGHLPRARRCARRQPGLAHGGAASGHPRGTSARRASAAARTGPVRPPSRSSARAVARSSGDPRRVKSPQRMPSCERSPADAACTAFRPLCRVDGRPAAGALGGAVTTVGPTACFRASSSTDRMSLVGRKYLYPASGSGHWPDIAAACLTPLRALPSAKGRF